MPTAAPCDRLALGIVSPAERPGIGHQGNGATCGVPGSDLTAPAAGPQRDPHTDSPQRLGLRGLLATRRGFGRLLAVRLTAQLGDGMFQGAFAGALLFNPERQTNPLAVAAAATVLFLPYSIIGPFAGALLDLWDRRRVLWAANLLRAGLTVLVAALVAGGVPDAVLYPVALAVFGATRFVLAGLSAALPHVVDQRHLIEANVVAATAGAAIAVLGGTLATALRAVLGGNNAGSASITLIAALGAVGAALLAVGFRRGFLGPDQRCDTRRDPRRAIAEVTRGLYEGARATVRVPSVSSSLVALLAHRLAFGIATLLMLLLFRHAFTGNGVLLGGMGGIGEMLVVGAAGIGAAALVTPWLTRRLGRAGAIRVALVATALIVVLLATHISMVVALAGAFLVTTGGQVVKLCTDASIQSDIGDEHRGRVFALDDAIFNLAYVAAIAVAALRSPPDGRSPHLLLTAAACYLLGLAAHELLHRRPTRPQPTRVGDFPSASREISQRESGISPG
jgi:MFS family permease